MNLVVLGLVSLEEAMAVRVSRVSPARRLPLSCLTLEEARPVESKAKLIIVGSMTTT